MVVVGLVAVDVHPEPAVGDGTKETPDGPPAASAGTPASDRSGALSPVVGATGPPVGASSGDGAAAPSATRRMGKAADVEELVASEDWACAPPDDGPMAPPGSGLSARRNTSAAPPVGPAPPRPKS